MRQTIPFVSLLAALGASSLAAQDIPPYVPANPILESRSALYLQPFIAQHSGWQVRVLADYYNAIEVAATSQGPLRETLFDAEILQADFSVTRDLSPRVFVIGDLPVRGGYNGFLDGFLNWYHNLIGLQVPARNEQPDNVFQWRFTLPDTTVTRQRPGTFIGDARAGVGVRFGRTELIGTVTLPTGTPGTDGWTRHVVGTSATLVTDLVRNRRVTIDAGATGGFTPTSGPLAPYQRTTFAGGFAGLRWRFAGRQAVFGTAWVQSSNWKGTGWGAVDDAEVVSDFGFLLRLSRRGPELQLGMTQDLIPKGPAMDVGFSVGLRWN